MFLFVFVFGGYSSQQSWQHAALTVTQLEHSLTTGVTMTTATLPCNNGIIHMAVTKARTRLKQSLKWEIPVVKAWLGLRVVLIITVLL